MKIKRILLLKVLFTLIAIFAYISFCYTQMLHFHLKHSDDIRPFAYIFLSIPLIFSIYSFLFSNKSKYKKQFSASILLSAFLCSVIYLPHGVLIKNMYKVDPIKLGEEFGQLSGYQVNENDQKLIFNAESKRDMGFFILAKGIFSKESRDYHLNNAYELALLLNTKDKYFLSESFYQNDYCKKIKKSKGLLNDCARKILERIYQVKDFSISGHILLTSIFSSALVKQAEISRKRFKDLSKELRSENIEFIKHQYHFGLEVIKINDIIAKNILNQYKYDFLYNFPNRLQITKDSSSHKEIKFISISFLEKLLTKLDQLLIKVENLKSRKSRALASVSEKDHQTIKQYQMEAKNYRTVLNQHLAMMKEIQKDY